MSRYMLIGVERSEQQHLRSGQNISNIPKHLLITKRHKFCHDMLIHEKYVYDEYRDAISIADVDNIICNRLRVIKLSLSKLDYFQRENNVKVFCPKNMDRYGNTNVPGNQPMIIINRIGTMGCQCVDVHGNIVNLQNADVLTYANTWGIANAKVYEKIGYPKSTVVISGIGWTIPVISVEQAKRNQQNIPETPEIKKLSSYIAKSKMIGAGDFEVDLATLALIKCNNKNIDTLRLPPVKIISFKALEGVKASKVIIPDTVEIIEERAFYDASINELCLPNSLKSVDTDAFFGIHNLNVLTIDSQKAIKQLLNEFRNGIRVINIGANISDISGCFKDDFPNLEAFNVSNDNKHFASINRAFYN